MDLKVFHDYDIRGIYPSEINEAFYKNVGRALAIYTGLGPIAVGHDMRISSPSLSRALIEGITMQGINVIELGLISTEMLYFAEGKFGYPLSVIVSASHNPPQYNGLKGVLKGMIALNSGFGFPEVKNIIQKNEYREESRTGTITKIDILNDWISHILSFIDSKSLKPLKVVVDAGNGMAGMTWDKLIGKLPIEIVPLYFKPDGTFPHHIPNPLEEDNLKDLKEKIKETEADVGFAFDGDADRFFILDENAKVLSGTITTAILAKHLLQKNGPGPILYNAIVGKIAKETIENYGGTPKRVRVGHSFIKQYMSEYGGLFAGEHSGHYYFRDNHNADSSAIAALLFLEYVSKEKKRVSEIHKEFDKYPQSGEMNFKADDIPIIIEKIKNAYEKVAISQDHVDGLSIWLKDWWFNIRASKTEPLLRLNIEADNKEVLKQKTKEIVEILQKEGAHRKE